MLIRSDNARGALLMMGAMSAYTINDAFLKGLAGQIPLFQAVLIRGVATVVLLVLICRMMGQLRFAYARSDWLWISLRALAEAIGTYLFLSALFHMPIANVSAILQALPLTVGLAAAVFLGEPLGWRRLLAIGIGFFGVLLIIQPGGADFSIYSIYALGTVACVTFRDIAVRRISRDVPVLFVALTTAMAVTLLGALGMASVGWQPVTAGSAILLAGATGCLVLGYILSVSVMRVGDIGFIAPFRYTGLLVALFLGILVFDEWPNALTALGALIVVLTGLFTLYRERQLQRLSKPS